MHDNYIGDFEWRGPEHAEPSDTLTLRQRLILAGSFVALLGVLAVLASAMYVAHQSSSGIVPAPAPVAPAAPAIPAPVTEQPPVMIPDNA